MLYVVLCYNDEAAVQAWTQEEDDELMARLSVAHEKLSADGKLGPHARLMWTSTATTLKPGEDSVVLDGPFAETKEQLLGFYVLDCASGEEALEAGRLLAKERSGGSLEIRPVRVYYPGVPLA
jgi:hypothetical protein